MYGYRPTTKRYSSKGIVPLSHSTDTIGLLANNLEDIELFDSIITCGDERSNSPGCYGTLYNYGDRIRIGVSKFYFFMSLSMDVGTPVLEILETLSKNSKIELVDAEMIGIERLVKKSSALIEHEVNIDLPKFLHEYNTGISFDNLIDGILSDDVEELIEKSKEKFDSGRTKVDYRAALQERIRLREFYEKFFEKHQLDAIIYPTTPIEAKSTEDCHPSIIMDGKHVHTLKTLTQNTDPGSYAGLPSISMPLAKTSAGLPVGIQLETLENHDRLLFEIAAVVRDAIFKKEEDPVIASKNDDTLLI